MKSQSHSCLKSTFIDYKPIIYCYFYCDFPVTCCDLNCIYCDFCDFRGHRKVTPISHCFFKYLEKGAKITVTGKVTVKNALNSLQTHKLALFCSTVTFERGVWRFQDFIKSAVNLFRQNPLKVYSLSESFKQRL